MKEVKIEYPFLFIFRKTEVLHVPEGWPELTARQFAACTRVFTGACSGGEFISGFFGIKKSAVRRLDKFQQYRLAEMAEFISAPRAAVNFFYLPEIPGAGLHAPDRRLKDVTFERFSLFDTFFFDCLNDKGEASQARFIAALYLKRGEKVTGIDFDRRVRLIEKTVDKATRYAIFRNYTFIRKWLAKAYPFLFGFTEGEPDRPKGTDRAKKANRPDWNGVLDAIAGDDILHYEDYKQIPCLTVFRQVNRRISNYNKHDGHDKHRI